MLQNLHVKNLALIDESDVLFGPGLNILSGETGAGKSILIGSIHLALGEKIPREMLRENAGSSLVELVFSVDAPAQIRELNEMDIVPEDGQIVMTRKISAGGRSVCRINGETVSAALMRRAASLLIDIHGQQEHQSLLTRRNHMRYLDAYAKKELDGKLDVLAERYHTYEECRRARKEASLDEKEQARQLSFLQYEIDEIERANLEPGEDDALEAEYRRLSNGRKILDAASECREYCADGPQGASDQIGRGLRALLGVTDYDEQAEELSSQLAEIDSLLSDFNRDLASYQSDFEFSQERFTEIQERLDLINHLKSKYGKTVEEILAQKEEKAFEAAKLTNYQEYVKELEDGYTEAERAVKEISAGVSEIRQAAAVTFVEEIKKALADLNFQDVRLSLEFERLDHYTANGWDDARFFISTNPGEPVRPLDSVASGGELSRIMLALKTVLAGNDDIETLIFDEIDSGISGRTAQMVAEKMKQIAKDHQVICITHLPQIAAMADTHFLISKTSDASTTISEIRPLDRGESIEELARMLGGAKITDAVMRNAAEMKEMAEQC